MLHDRLRKEPKTQKHSSVVDGVMGAPVRAGSVHPNSHRTILGTENFRSTTSRSADNFKRREGFHTANWSQSASRAAMPGLPGDKDKSRGRADHKQSILHMNLAGGSLGSNRQPRGHFKKRSRWSGFRRWTLRASAAIGVLVVVLGGFLFAKLYFGANNVFQGGGSAAALSCDADVDPASLETEGDGRINIMMVGLDNEAGLTDTIMVASIDPVGKTVATLSIPRDLWVSSPAIGSTKINAVYPLTKKAALASDPDNKEEADRKALSELESAVEEALGLQVNYHAAVDVAGFERAVEIVNGVTVNVPEELAVSEHLWDDVRGEPYFLDVPAGQQELDPQRALWFVRSRKTSTRGDFDRTERQRLFLQSLGREVLTVGNIANPVRLSKLMDTFNDNVTTNLSVDDAWCLSEIAREVPDDKVSSIGLADPPDAVVTTGAVGSQSVVMPVLGVSDFSQVHGFVRSRLVDGFIARENAGVLVLNGSGRSGYAAETMETLKSYGYNVLDARDAPAGDYSGNLVVDLKGDNPYTKHYLEKRFETSATRDLPKDILANEEKDKIDFVIILN